MEKRKKNLYLPDINYKSHVFRKRKMSVVYILNALYTKINCSFLYTILNNFYNSILFAIIYETLENDIKNKYFKYMSRIYIRNVFIHTSHILKGVRIDTAFRFIILMSLSVMSISYNNAMYNKFINTMFINP